MEGKERIKEIEAEMARPAFWQNQEQAKELVKELERLKKAGREYDKNNAILSLYAGAGGTDAQDWTELLLRMYLRYAERKGFKATVLAVTPGQEAGLKNATLEINGEHAYGTLKHEHGVHRLVRLSPFSAQNLRHTSFAFVEVLPELENIKEIAINPAELKIDTYRAGGPGGQYVNKTESAVRVTHAPTGLVVTSQSERSQAANKEKAMKLLASRLRQLLEIEKKGKIEELKGGHVPIEWGRQIRSYVLHPYKMVKDHRTGHETSDAEGVLNGDLDGFIKSALNLK